MRDIIDKGTRQRIIRRDGEKDILLHFFEEIGELMTKINHSRRNRCKKSEVESELADVIICLEFVKEILYLEDGLIDAKIEEKADIIRREVLIT